MLFVMVFKVFTLAGVVPDSSSPEPLPPPSDLTFCRRAFPEHTGIVPHPAITALLVLFFLVSLYHFGHYLILLLLNYCSFSLSYSLRKGTLSVLLTQNPSLKIVPDK